MTLAAFLLLACHHPEPPAPRDVILVTIDTWRADAAGFAGNARVKTPFLDSVAQRGIVFSEAHAHNVVTLPSHVNILTGLYPWQHGVRDNAGFTLDPKHATIATLLKKSGWTTGAFVGAFPLDARFGLNQGFDVYDDNYGKGAATLDFVVQERPAAAVLDAAAKWWRAQQGRRRFLWVHLYDAHAPYRPPAPFNTGDPYLGEVAAIDDALARQLAPLVEPTTLLIVSADHGEARGDHGELTHGLFAYESTLHVPLLVAGPGIEHRVEPAYVRHIDVVPTILGAAQLAKPPELAGTSLLEPIGKRDTYFESLSAWLNRGWAPLTGVIHENEKYVDLPIPELYALPNETNNLSNEKRRDVDAARKLLANLRGAAAASAAERVIPEEEAARLRSLGYIAGTASSKASYGPADDPKTLVTLDAKMHEVIDAYERNDLRTALALAQQVVKERPDMPSGRELLAFVLQQNDKPAEAIAELRTLVQRGEATDDMKAQLALLLSEGGASREAVALLAPIAAHRSDPDVLNAYGVALADDGKLDEAARQFQRVLDRDPNNAPALQNLGIAALRRDDAESARQYLTRALALNPRLPLALNTLGVLRAQEGDFAQAVELWKRAVAVDPRQYDALYNIGLAEGRAGHRAAAREALQRFVETAPRERYAEEIAKARAALR